DVAFADIAEFCERTFRHVAQTKALEFSIELAEDIPPTFRSDPKRVQQVLKNLLSNAFKFTSRGSVDLTIRRAESGWGKGRPTLDHAETVIALEVHDTGSGVPKDKQWIIFEAFQQ